MTDADGFLQCDIAIVGGGAVGLAIARAVADSFPEATTVLLERHGQPGEEASSRNSEVIHAGLYYPPGTLKARHCLRGRQALYAYCRARGIAHCRIGKLVVARHHEVGRLRQLAENARAGGVAAEDLQWLDRDQVRTLEPALEAELALFSRQSGIVDSHALMHSLLGDARAGGVLWSPRTTVTALHADAGSGYCLDTVSGSDRARGTLHCRVLVNAAGCGALELAGQLDTACGRGQPLPSVHLVRGQYFSWRGTPPFQRLIYPLPPEDGRGLGIHATPDLGGRMRFGPDARPVTVPDTRVDSDPPPDFLHAIRSYFPGVEADRLQPDYAGVRVRALWPEQSDPADFCLLDGRARGQPGVIHLLGIESPGLTAALSLADSVRDLIADQDWRYA